jgi:DNA-binding transcriptional regulator YiaG
LGQLLGIAQRTVVVFFGDFKQRFSPRKLIPTQVKTMGDYLLLMRIKANLSQPELAARTGFSVRKLMAWEHDRTTLSGADWDVLKGVLKLDESIRQELALNIRV